ncbi:hypothetical protein HLH36_00365 [Gluconacetobacter aggeris]|uniref:Uncharacterized protein n=1 Tax=Gluconacetobacter aggeris TaxID=1286186 RepID=A0A7W4IPV0_9PROT|nr:hypothetical protein [Gluconacetobacter aggeris]MBB2166824.1 hypothetical protein [Gluconacetobacter aggeris]
MALEFSIDRLKTAIHMLTGLEDTNHQSYHTGFPDLTDDAAFVISIFRHWQSIRDDSEPVWKCASDRHQRAFPNRLLQTGRKRLSGIGDDMAEAPQTSL